jgi:membrane protein implicated in regulation of membrane protease activity
MKKFLLSIIMIVFLGGCTFFDKKENNSTLHPTSIPPVAAVISQETTSIKRNVTTIQNDATIIQKSSTDVSVQDKASNIIEHAGLITSSANNIDINTKKLASIEAKYQSEIINLKKSTDKQVIELTKQLTAQKVETEKAKDSVNGWLYKGIIGGLSLILAGSIVMIFLGNKLGIPIAAGSLCAIATFIALQRFEIIFAILALVFAIFLIGSLFYDKWKDAKAIKSAAATTGALTDVVKMIDEVIKPALTEDIKKKIFGEKTPEASKVQSSETQKIVAQIRGK